jgi:hypothetical protein
MKYVQLAEFIDKKIRMSHIYQPVMLMTLLAQGGRYHERPRAPPIPVPVQCFVNGIHPPGY